MLRSLEPLPLAYAAFYSKCKGPLNNQLWPLLQNCPAFKALILIVISESKLYPHKPFLPKIVLLLLLHPPNQAPRKQCNGPLLCDSWDAQGWRPVSVKWSESKCEEDPALALKTQDQTMHLQEPQYTVWSAAWQSSTKIKSIMCTYETSTLGPCITVQVQKGHQS